MSPWAARSCSTSRATNHPKVPIPSASMRMCSLTRFRRSRLRAGEGHWPSIRGTIRQSRRKSSAHLSVRRLWSAISSRRSSRTNTGGWWACNGTLSGYERTKGCLRKWKASSAPSFARRRAPRPRHGDDLDRRASSGRGSPRRAPRIFAIADARVADQLRPAAAGFPFEVSSDVAELVVALRAFRRGADQDLTLRDELIEDAARSLAASTSGDALVIDVSESSTSCVLARPGELEAAHIVPLGLGAAADHVVARAGLDRVRRWLPRPVDAPALLERVFNRALWPGALPATESALALEMALAREAIAHALRDAEYAGLDVAAMRASPAVLVTGRAASFPRPAQTLLVAVDGLEPTALTTVFREPDDGRAERIALVLSISPRRSATVRLTHAGGRAEHRVARGAFMLVPISGDVDVSVKGARVKGIAHAGALGVLIDARGRPLVLPNRDAERIPAVSRWHATLRALPSMGVA